MDLLHCNWWYERNHFLGINSKQLQQFHQSAWVQRRLATAQTLLQSYQPYASSKPGLSMGLVVEENADYRIANWEQEQGWLYCQPERLPFANQGLQRLSLGLMLNFYPHPLGILCEGERVLTVGGELLCVNWLLPPRSLKLRAWLYSSPEQLPLLRARHCAPWQLYSALRSVGLSVTNYQRSGALYLMRAQKRGLAPSKRREALARFGFQPSPLAGANRVSSAEG